MATEENETNTDEKAESAKKTSKSKSTASKPKSSKSKSTASKSKSKSSGGSRRRKKKDDDADAVKAADAEAEAAEAADETAKADDADKASKAESKSKAKKDDAKKDDAKKADAKKDEPKKNEKPKPKQWRPKARLTAGTKWLETLFEKMHLEGIEVDATLGDKVLEYNVHGGDAHLLLGAGKASAKALESIQTILRETLVNGYDTNYDVHLDVDSFRQRRTEHLESVAKGLAKAAASIGSPLTVAGFNSFERRVVHQTLQDDSDVTTDSEGRGSFRKLRVEPR
jgi:spoIIIJ-associated protein